MSPTRLQAQEPGALTDTEGLYVYGIVGGTGQAVPDGLTGLDDAPVRLVGDDEVAAAVAVVAWERPPGRRRDLLAHARVLDTLAEAGPVVPMHFGTLVPGPTELGEDLLLPRREQFLAMLEELAGTRQFVVRGRYHEHAVLSELVAEDAEIAALRERTRDLPEDAGHADRLRLGELVAHGLERKREQDEAIVLDIVLRHVEAYAPRSGSGLDHVLDIAFLVSDAKREAFEDALESVAEAMHERLRLQLMGPTAPYDFVGQE